MTKQLLKYAVVISACFLSGCWWNEDTEERVYTVYVKVKPNAVTPQPTPEATPEPTPDVVAEPEMAEPSPTPTVTATPIAPPKIVKPKPTPVPTPVVDKKFELQAKRFYSSVVNELETRGLLADDIKDGKQRLATIQKLLVKRDYAAATTMLESFNDEVLTTTVDDAFITSKNTRLLNLIQEVKPSAEVQAQIDKESEIINQLMEHSDFSAINRRMNDLFNLVEKSRH